MNDNSKDKTLSVLDDLTTAAENKKTLIATFSFAAAAGLSSLYYTGQALMDTFSNAAMMSIEENIAMAASSLLTMTASTVAGAAALLIRDGLGKRPLMSSETDENHSNKGNAFLRKAGHIAVPAFAWAIGGLAGGITYSNMPHQNTENTAGNKSEQTLALPNKEQGEKLIKVVQAEDGQKTYIYSDQPKPKL